MNNRLERSLTVFVILTTVVVGLAADTAPVVHWKFDETRGTTALDSAGRAPAGNLLGGLSFDKDSVNGVFGSALRFDGRDDRIELPKSFTLPTDAFSIAFWFNPESALSSASSKCCFLDCSKGSKVFCVHFNSNGQGRIGLHCGRGEDEIEIYSRTNSWSAESWHHICITFDGTSLRMYVGGELENTLDAPGSKRSFRVNIGCYSSGDGHFRGTLDEFRIYSSALTTAEVRKLRRPHPVLQSLTRGLIQSRNLVEEKKYRDAISVLEEKIGESEQWRAKNPEVYLRGLDDLCFDLRFLLAQTEKSAEFPARDIGVICQRAFEKGVAPTNAQRLGHILLWLCENVDPRVYYDILGRLLESNKSTLAGVSSEAEQLLNESKPNQALRFTETSLAGFDNWRTKHVAGNSQIQPALADVYLQVAKARKATGMPAKAIAEAYSKAFGPSNMSSAHERSTGLIWLLENGFEDELAAAIKSFAQRPPANGVLVGDFCRHLESKKNWVGFERFLDTLFAHAKSPAEWLVFLESCLSDRGNRWARGYFHYVNNKPKLKFARDCSLAQEYLAKGDFDNAAQLYEDIVTRCDAKDDKGLFEFQLCKCLSRGSRYRQAGRHLDSFISDYKVSHPDLAKEAILMKGKLCVQLGEVDEASQEFRRIITEYPQAKQIAEAGFLIGYCRMLQNRSEEARRALTGIVQDYPESSWANKARLCLAKLKNAGDGGTAKKD